MNKPRDTKKSAGFTIVELMVATTVFSVILIIVAFGLIRIGHVYYKGLNSSRVQNVTRSAIDEVTQAIQLSDGKVSYISGSGARAYCINSNKHFVFWLNDLQTTGEASRFTSYNGTADCSFAAIQALPNSRSILSENMRVLDFRICNADLIGIAPQCTAATAPTAGLTRVTLSVAYGADDLINNTPGNPSCRTVGGSQFCAISTLTTVISSRL